jgi:hypothetical protein
MVEWNNDNRRDNDRRKIMCRRRGGTRGQRQAMRTVGGLGRARGLILHMQMHSRCNQPRTKHQGERDNVITSRLLGHAEVSDRSSHRTKVSRRRCCSVKDIKCKDWPIRGPREHLSNRKDRDLAASSLLAERVLSPRSRPFVTQTLWYCPRRSGRAENYRGTTVLLTTASPPATTPRRLAVDDALPMDVCVRNPLPCSARRSKRPSHHAGAMWTVRHAAHSRRRAQCFVIHQ